MDAQRVAEAIAPAGRDGPLSLYVHIPFCETKCPYCDFNTYAGIESLIPAYVGALSTEIRRWGRRLGPTTLRTIFLGGGTPSYLPIARLATVVEAWQQTFQVDPEAEITIEANPDDCSLARLRAFLGLGINRISIGMQSLDDGLLKGLGRRHDARQALTAYSAARRAGFDNVSIDLMYGLPEQSVAQWRDTLDRSIALQADHMSLYALTIEPNTPLHTDVDSGRVPTPDEDLAADMYLLACERLEAAGYRHYEISNWARPGRESRHNLTYWANGQYLGVGPGAHSSLRGRRFANMKSPRGYVDRMDGLPSDDLDCDPVEAMRAAGPVAEIEPSTQSLEMADTMMMGLRLDGGVSVARFEERFDADPRDVFHEAIGNLTARKLLEVTEYAIRVPQDAWIVGNEVFSRFVDAPETDRRIPSGAASGS